MTSHHLRVTTEGRDGTIHLDDHDISHSVTGLTVQLDARELPTVELHLLIHSTELHNGDTKVTIPDETAQLLTTLGWTPPPGE